MVNDTKIQEIAKLLDEKLAPIQKTLNEHGEILKGHTDILKEHGKVLKSLKTDQSIMLNMLDGEQMDQRKRLARIEEHLDLPNAS